MLRTTDESAVRVEVTSLIATVPPDAPRRLISTGPASACSGRVKAVRDPSADRDPVS